MVNRSKRKKGYTLIELTISIGLLGLVIVLTAGVLISVVRSYQRQRVIAEIERNADHAMRVIEESLVGALSVDCVDFTGNPFNNDTYQMSIICNGTEDRFLRISYGTRTNYITAGAGTGRVCSGSPTLNCFVLIADNLGDTNPIQSETKLTNDSQNSGVNIDQFEFAVGRDSSTGGPTIVIVTMTVSGAKGSSWTDETRTFQNFLTVRGTYK